jgi:hypothetical protein
MPAEGGTNPTAATTREWLSRSHATGGFTPYTASRIAYEGGKLRLRHYAVAERCDKCEANRTSPRVFSHNSSIYRLFRRGKRREK